MAARGVGGDGGEMERERIGKIRAGVRRRERGKDFARGGGGGGGEWDIL